MHNRMKAAVISVLALGLAAGGFAQAKKPAAPKPAGCKVTDDVEYSKKIREVTTEKYFTTELVDHLPASTCVPSPAQALGHIVGAPDVLTYTKDINAYMRLLAEKSPRV